MNSKEEWRDIVNYEGLYQVSNLGRVKSLCRYFNTYNKSRYVKREKILKQQVNQGYYAVVLKKNNISKTYKVHRLVAQAFISNKEDLPEINHKDCNGFNNKEENLEWCTSVYNNHYGNRPKKAGESLKKRNDKIRNSKIVLMFDMEDNLIKEFRGINECMAYFNMDYHKANYIYRVIRGERKHFNYFKFKYKEEDNEI